MLTQKTAPVYPDAARDARIEGDVQLKVRIGADGHVLSAEPLDGSPVLAAAAQEAVMRYAYRPVLLNGNLVEVDTTVTVPFRLDGAVAQAYPQVVQRIDVPNSAANSGTTAPVLLFKKEPEYSEEARKAKYQGTVTLYVIIGVDGRVRESRVMRSLGLGLDEKAIEAVNQWKFKPAYSNGQPVEAPSTIEVQFRLLDTGNPVFVSGSPALQSEVNSSSTTFTTRAVSPAPEYSVPPPPGLRPAVLIFKKEPEYTAEARAAKYQGTVVLSVTIGADGIVSAAKVLRSLGMGLDEKAIEAVRQWRFRPATQDGNPIEMVATVEVNFRPL